MKDVLHNWFKRYFTDPQATVLLFFLIIGVLVITYLGEILAPALASVVIAYVIDWIADSIEFVKIPRKLAGLIAFLVFISLLIVIFIGVVPIILQQASSLLSQVPTVIKLLQTSLLKLPHQYPELIDEQGIIGGMEVIREHVTSMGQFLVSKTLSTLPGIISLFVYLIIVPLMVFFFIYDRDNILRWIENKLPDKRNVLSSIWQQVNLQLGNYVRGKIIEIVIVGAVSFVSFFILKINYLLLLSVCVGLSVLIPYVGAAIVTLPIAIVGFMQFGWSSELLTILIVYGVIQALDGNVLVPLLFSEAVNIHPIAIILAILVFGGLWGFWGLFFSIPLAILVKTIIEAWPRAQ